ncbi:MAG: portal protein [bacterium]|nr:portal protein [bacterium]
MPVAAADTRELRRHIVARMRSLDDRRRPWIDGCKQVARELLPSRLPFLLDATHRERAGEHNSHIVDSVGNQSLLTAAAGIASGSWPASSEFYDLTVRNEFGPDDDARGFLQASRRNIRTLHNQSNANTELDMFAIELVAFGTAVSLILPDNLDVFRFETLSVGEYWLAEDHRAQVDTIYRKLAMTVGQLEQQFGRDALSTRTLNLLDKREFDEVVSVVHAIEPDSDGLNPEGSNPEMPWRSVYYEEESSSDDGVLGVRGFARFPAMVTRWTKLPGSPYGTGRGLDTLPHLIRLRRMIYRYGQAMALKADPPLQLPPGVQAHEVRALPGSKSSNNGSQSIEPLYKHMLDLRELDKAIELTRQEIRDSLGATLVSSLRSLTHQMTAREVDERRSQDLAEFLPALSRLHKEGLEAMIELEWLYTAEAGLLPPPPESLPDDIDIEFNSPLARKQRQAEVDAIVRTFTIGGEMAQGFGDVLDNLNADGAIRRIAEIEGMPIEALEPMAKVHELRTERQEVQRRQAQAAAAQQSVEFARQVGEAQQANGPVAVVN